MRILLHISLLLLALLASGCMNYFAPFSTEPAHPGLESARHAELSELPAPREKVVVAVYRFRDQTGQYKAAETGASWSTAVTQGATSILMRALEESDWFVVIEREGLSNLLNERQIVQSIRAQHTGPDGQQLGPLPPLLYGGILLEGGIIGYDTNVLTGGTGARYLGTGGSGQYRQDQVTVYLRAVSTQTGRVLKTVHVTKTIVSQKMDGGLFRFVETNRILENEAGYSYNEPPVLAVTEAIEESVKNLVIEGVRENLWAPADPAAAATSDAFLAYDADRARADRTDYFGRLVRENRPGVALGLAFGAQQYQGNYVDPLTRPTGELVLRGTVAPRWGLQLGLSAGEIGADRVFERAHVAADASLVYYLLPRARLTPFARAGVGLMAQSEGGLLEPDWSDYFGYGTLAGGLEWMATPRLGLSLALSADYAMADGLDGVTLGRIHDSVWSLRTGLTLYPF